MGIPTRLTIQDYFKHRESVCLQPKKCGKTVMDADASGPGAAFSNVLAGAQASLDGRAQGLCIRDYMKRRIPSHPPAAVDKVSSAAILPSPVVAPQKMNAVHKTVSKIRTQYRTPQSEQVPHEKSHTEDRRKILASIDRAAAQFGLPAALIRAVVKAESNYQVRALSPAGAQGLMQLMPATARELGVTDPFDIDQNIRGGAQYLRNMLDQFEGDVHLALSAYNAGPGTVARYAGDVPYAETRTYVRRVLRYAQEFSSPEVT